MSSISLKGVVSSVFNVDNSANADRAYDISARVSVRNGVVSNFEAGSVVSGESQIVASFSYTKVNNNLNVTFIDGDDSAVLTGIREFIQNSQEKLANVTYSLQEESEESE